MAVAREFARALDPGRAPGPLAPTLFVVLSAASLPDAHADLDEAGWPELDLEEIADTITPPAAGLGGDVSPDESSWADDKPSATAESATESGQRSPAGEPKPQDIAGQSRDEDADSAAADGTAGQPPAGRAGDEPERTSGTDSGASEEDAAVPSAEGIGGRSRNKEPGRAKPARRSRLRSYVLPPNDETDAAEVTEPIICGRGRHPPRFGGRRCGRALGSAATSPQPGLRCLVQLARRRAAAAHRGQSAGVAHGTTWGWAYRHGSSSSRAPIAGRSGST